MPQTGCTATAVLLILCHLYQCFALRDFIRKSDLPKIIPQSGETNWISLDRDTQFLPADVSGTAFSSQVARRLASSNNPYASQAFADGENDYDSYQQAWRYLGFMIDCTTVTHDDDDHHSNDDEGCSRYVLWAAYVDFEYEGGGIGEYQYWNRKNAAWDSTSCNFASGGNSRCAKMDCHLEGTHFTPLGFFKHKDHDEWMGQLFKHEGMCIWTEDEYSFMKQARKAWPNKCTVTESYYDGENPLYYDLKPASKGDITIGLYTDSLCTVEYTSQGSNDPNTLENVVGNLIMNGGSGKSRDNNGGDDSAYSTLAEAQAAWDTAFDIFKICQPCTAYDLTNVGHNLDDDSMKGSGYYTDDGGKSSGDDFDCYDDAGYTNVNQCMKFMAKTTMYAATYRDIALALEQNVIVDNPFVGGTSQVSHAAAVGRDVVRVASSVFIAIFFAISCLILLSSLLWLRRFRRLASSPRFPLKESLVMT